MASAAVKITVDEFLALPEIENLHRNKLLPGFALPLSELFS